MTVRPQSPDVGTLAVVDIRTSLTSTFRALGVGRIWGLMETEYLTEVTASRRSRYTIILAQLLKKYYRHGEHGYYNDSHKKPDSNRPGKDH